MKKQSILIVLFILYSAIGIQAQSYKVDVKLDGLKAGIGNFVIYDPDAPNGYIQEMIPVADNHFVLAGESAYPRMASISFDQTVKQLPGGFVPVRSSCIWLILVPGVNTIVSGKITDYPEVYIRDGGENQQLSELNAVIFPLLNEAGNCYVSSVMDTTLQPAGKASLVRMYEGLETKALQLQKKWVEEHPSSVASLWLIGDMFARKQFSEVELASLLAKVEKEYHQHPYYLDLMSRSDASKAALAGSMVPALSSANTADSSLFDLQSLRGKYVVLDFWGTWCGPCMQGMPQMRKMKEKYPDRLEIVGIASESNRKTWLDAIRMNNLNWIHVFNGTREENFVIRFNVIGYPTKILISPEGKILFRCAEETEDFYQKVDEFLNT